LNQFKKKENIILLFTFNHEPILDNILFLKNFHKNSFKNIVFCGRNILNIAKESFSLKQFSNLTLIELDTIQGYLHYDCMSKVIEMKFRSDGILLLSDDAIFKNWNFNTTFKNNIMYHKNPKCLNDIDFNNNWTGDVRYWMGTSYGYNALKKLSFNLELILNKKISTSSIDYEIIVNYLKQLNINSNNTQYNKLIKFCKEASDIFYIPNSLFYKYNLISNLFKANNVFLEFAVPTILSGLITNDDLIFFFNLKYSWGGIQFDLEANYNDSFVIGHPFKLSRYNSPNERLKICKIFVQDYFDRL
jgi:hypothetical protein